VIDETSERQSPKRRPTRAQQRVATRQALTEATAKILVDDGYAALTTRRVAEVAGVAQSTLMHHFETREALLVEAVTHLALRLVDEALDEIDIAALRSPAHRDAVLDQAWRKFTSPQALAAAQLWVAAWSEPELAATLRDLEVRLGGIIGATAATLFPDQADDPGFTGTPRRSCVPHPRPRDGHPDLGSALRRREVDGDQADPADGCRGPAGLDRSRAVAQP